MKAFTLVALLALLVCAPVAAAELDEAAVDRICRSASELAESTMQVRQLGAPITDVLQLHENADPAIKPLIQALVRDAYSRPRFLTEEHQQRAATEFASEAYVTCFTSMSR